MLGLFKRLALGLILIAGTSALLLLSDLGSRVKPKPALAASAPTPAVQEKKLRIALLQQASQPILDQGRQGMMDGLAEKGWREGENFELKRYNAEGDMAVAQTIAKEMAGGGYDLLMTITTPSLQAVANANKAGKTRHVFGLVTDPYSAGIGASRENHLDHPAHLAGYGTMQPVALCFKIAREMNPSLTQVGVIWNAAEANSEAQVKLARKVCAELGITLVESSIDNSSGVGEAAGALVARGVEAIWICGDGTVMTAIETVIAAANKNKIPVFTVVPPNIKRGVLFDVGADYHEVGRLVGSLAGEVLSGRSLATVPIENVMPEKLMLNLQVLPTLRDKWTIPDHLRQEAAVYLDEQGIEHSKAAPKPEAAALATPHEVPIVSPPLNPNPTGKKWKIALIAYNETPPTEETLAGMNDAWKHSPLVAGRDYELKLRSAQGDIAAVSGIIDAALTEGADLIVPLSTPCLQVAVKKVKDRPIVFSLIANPMIVGAGRSYTDHLPNVTGITVAAPVEAALDMVQKYFPAYQRLGTLFCPAEANSVDLMEALAAQCKKRGLTLETVAVNTPSEMPDAALALTGRPIDAILQISDNLSSASFTAITRAARQAQKPLLSMNSTTIALGAPVSLGRDYHNGGEATTALLERVIRGESPGSIPFTLPPKIVYKASEENARAVGMTLPPELLREFAAAGKSAAVTAPAAPAAPAVPPAGPAKKKWKISLVLYNETPPAEETLGGMKDAWKRSSFVEGRDYEIKFRSAQGDMSMLGGLFDAVRGDGADLVVTLSTPTLQMAVNKVKNTPVVFTLVTNPMAAGAGKSYEEHLPNVTGIAVLAPVSEALDLLQKHFPACKRLGTLYCPAEANAVYLKEYLEQLCRARGFTLETTAVNSATELPDAALALMSRPIDAVLQIPDALSSAGFSAIAHAARQTQKPLFALTSTVVAQGAAVGLGRDFHNAGEATVALIERIFRGEDPARIPFALPPKVFSIASPANAAAMGLTLPEALLKDVDKVIP